MFSKKKNGFKFKIILLFIILWAVVLTAIILLTTDNGKIFKDDKDVKIAIELFNDFECPFSMKHSKTIAQMLDKYGDKIDLAIKHYPLPFHPNAQKAAEAFECAKEQGEGLEMYDKIFRSQKDKNMSVKTWKAAAGELGLNVPKFNSCLDNDKYADKIEQDKREAEKRGIRGTPATFINGEKIIGAAPFSELKEAIEKNL